MGSFAPAQAYALHLLRHGVAVARSIARVAAEGAWCAAFPWGVGVATSACFRARECSFNSAKFRRIKVQSQIFKNAITTSSSLELREMHLNV